MRSVPSKSWRFLRSSRTALSAAARGPRRGTGIWEIYAGEAAIGASVTVGIGGSAGSAGTAAAPSIAVASAGVALGSGLVAHGMHNALQGTATLMQSKGGYSKELSKESQRGIRSLERQISQHEKKLAEFKANPTVRPGMEGQSKEVVEAAQQSRIRYLEKEIKTFKESIKKLQEGE